MPETTVEGRKAAVALSPFVIPDLIRDPAFLDASIGFGLKLDPGSGPG